MEKLDKYIKGCNLVFTDTMNRLDFCRVDFDIDKTEVNYAHSINLLQLVSSFNKLYLSFKKEYDELDKLNLGKTIEVLSFGKFNYNGDNYRNLTLYIDNPIITNHENTILYLREINNEIKPFVTNDKLPSEKGYYQENVKLNKDIAKKYLDLFEKYHLLLETYNHLKNNRIFADGTNYISTNIDNYDNNNLLKGLRTFKITFGSTYFDTNYHVEFSINLGENFGIDYDSCKLFLDDENTFIDNANYDKIFEDVFINKKYLKKRD